MGVDTSNFMLGVQTSHIGDIEKSPKMTHGPTKTHCALTLTRPEILLSTAFAFELSAAPMDVMALPLKFTQTGW